VRPACLAVLFVPLGCLAVSPEVRPLYPHPEQRVDRGAVAWLGGYVRMIDDQDVAPYGSAVFELLPGCHVVWTPRQKVLGGEAEVLTTATGHVPFVLDMRAGYSYAIELRSGPTLGPRGCARLIAIEMDANGNTVREIGPARRAEDITACNAVGAPP
jgi:hypothetical protein